MVVLANARTHTAIGMFRASRLSADRMAVPFARMTSGARRTSSPAADLTRSGLASGKAVVNFDVAPFRPSEPLQPGAKRRQAGLRFRLCFRHRHQHADAPQLRRALQAATSMPRLPGLQ
jgi:hypothetical protein